MNLSRRELLYTSLAAGTMLAMPSLAWPLVSEPGIRPRRLGRLGLLIGENGVEAADFREGAVAACQSLGLAAPQVFAFDRTWLCDFRQLRQQVAATAGTPIIGLFDDASALLIGEAIRELGGSICCSGAHAAAGPTETSYHRLLCVQSSTGIGIALARSLAAAGRAGVVHEATLAPPPAPELAADHNYRPPPLGSWPTALGLLLVHVGAGAWRNGPAVAETRFGSFAARLPAATSLRFVSLVAHIPTGAQA